MRQLCLLSASALLSIISPIVAQEHSWKDSGLHLTLLPSTAPPDDPEDSYQCVFSNASQYLDPPQPTGVLKTAFWDYGDELIARCVDDGGKVENCWPGKEKWCDFTTKAPDALTPALSAWGSSATSWWSDHSSDAVDVASKCPQNWFDAMMDLAANRQWLNLTIAWSGCNEEQKEVMPTGQLFTSTSAAPVSTGQDDKATATDVPDESPSFKPNNLWIITSGVFATTFVNAAL